jgi:XTP/dITP diphosphohydrolase
VGRLLFAAASVARSLGVDPETALRARATAYRDEIRAAEGLGPDGPAAGTG